MTQNKHLTQKHRLTVLFESQPKSLMLQSCTHVCDVPAKQAFCLACNVASSFRQETIRHMGVTISVHSKWFRYGIQPFDAHLWHLTKEIIELQESVEAMDECIHCGRGESTVFRNKTFFSQT